MISHLHISGYRGIPDEHLSLSYRTSIIGANGSGKTHILEAIHIASGGHLHYFHAPQGEEVQFEIIYTDDIGPKSYMISRRESRDTYKIQGSKVSGVKYREELPYRTVFLSPFDMNLLYFTPSMRREYVDSILSRTFAQFPKVRREYEGVLRQRNALLKKIREGEARREDLDYWDETFATKANLYITYRTRWIDFVVSTKEPLRDFLPKYGIDLVYESKLDKIEEKEDFIKKYLLENRERDVLTGHTHIGPHLDDFGFWIFGESQKQDSPTRGVLTKRMRGNDNEVDATMMLSRGEMKMLLLALKQIEILFLQKYLDLPIVLLFDDLFAELDSSHAQRVIETFDASQVIVTTQRSLPLGEKWDDFSCIHLDLR